MTIPRYRDVGTTPDSENTMTVCGRTARGFSLVELVIVVVIIGIIGAIAIPRLSRGSAGAADGALRGNLAVLRNAIELYAAEHDGKFPTLTDFEAQLTGKTNAAGAPGSTAGEHIFGPYLKAIPPLPVGADKGKKTIVAAYAAGNGWVYNATTGDIRANTAPAEEDVTGTAYNTY